ncbi:lantibiotic dehydratase [Actinomyces bowdenii]|uniref:lantibiotic dehydratase n=1 Tax=Actinomyces bowdenii TaxID=131109 RepID=UPI001D1691BA|nr:lantibiotic dehydratase [Actinomyces bowdenii]
MTLPAPPGPDPRTAPPLRSGDAPLRVRPAPPGTPAGPAIAEAPSPSQAAAHSGVVIAFPTLVRMGGLPARAVPEPQAGLIAALEHLRRLDEDLKRTGQRLLDPLYEAIPTLARPQRRAVLSAKRRVYQGRQAAVSAQVRAELPPGIAAMLSEWDDLVGARQEAHALLEAQVEADLAHARALLARGLDEPGYLSSLAVAAPALVAALSARGPRLEDPRMLRSLYTLATRTALKTSPFSGLTTVAEAARPAQGRSLCTVALHLAHGILAATARQIDPDGFLQLESAPVTRAPSPRGATGAAEPGEQDRQDQRAAPHEAGQGQDLPLAAVAEHDYANGMHFRREEIQPAQWVLACHEAFSARQPGSAPVGVAEAMRLLGGRNPRLRLSRLLASGAVRPRVPWQRGEEPFIALAGTLSPDQFRVWGQDLVWLSGLGRAVQDAPGPQRAELLTRAGRLAQRIFPDGELGTKPSGLLYEDRESQVSWDEPADDERFAQDARTLAALADPWVTRSRIYDLMVERFVARYGSGGVCQDALAFLMALAHAPDGDAQMLRASTWDYTAGPNPERAAMPGGLSACPRHLGAYLQPVTTGSAPLTQELTVVNALTSGHGALQARFHRLLGQDYRQRLARRIRHCWGLERVLEVQAATECHTGQAVSCGVLPPLGLPGEPPSAQAVALQSLRLVHDPSTRTLFLADGRGPVGLAYLGLIPQHRLGGYLAWLALLSDPWARLAPFADHWLSRSRERTGPLPQAVVHEPRAVHGRLVTRRESWTLPAQQLTRLLDRDPTVSLIGVAGLREQWGLPAEVYVLQHLPSRGATFDEHKPRYVDLCSPVSLLALRGWIDPAAEHLTLVEALPGREGLKGLTAGGEATVVEYLIGMQWPKETGVGAPGGEGARR